jgi:hypothetical protein
MLIDQEPAAPPGGATGAPAAGLRSLALGSMRLPTLLFSGENIIGTFAGE